MAQRFTIHWTASTATATREGMTMRIALREHDALHSAVTEAQGFAADRKEELARFVAHKIVTEELAAPSPQPYPKGRWS